MTVTNAQNKYMSKSYLLGGALVAGVLLGTSVHASADEVTNANNDSQNTSAAKPSQAQIGVDVNHNSVDKATQDAKDAGVQVTTNTNTKIVNADEADSAKKSVEENEAQQAQNVADTTKQQQENTDATNQANAQIDKANADSQNQTNQANAQLQDAIQKAKDAGIEIDTNGTVKYAYDNTKYDSSNADTVKKSAEDALNWLKTNTDTSVKNAQSQTDMITEVTNQYIQAKQQLESENKSIQAQLDAIENVRKQAVDAGVIVNTDNPLKTSDYDEAVKRLTEQQALLTATLQQRQKDVAKYDSDLANWKQQVADVTARNKAKQDDYDAKVKALNDSLQEPGHANKIVNQQLHVNSEPNAHLEVTTSGDVTPDNATNTSGTLRSGGSVTGRYTNLQNSSYKGRKIASMVETVRYESATGNEQIWYSFNSDPAAGIYHARSFTSEGQLIEETVDIERTYYYEDGSPVVFNGDAYISAGSLNEGYENGNYYSEQSKFNDGQFITINGSSITHHDDGWDHGANSLHNQDGSKREAPYGIQADGRQLGWDWVGNPTAWYGAALYEINNGASTLHFQSKTITADAYPWTTNWWISTSELPVPVVPDKPVFETVPDKPEEPTPATLNITPVEYDRDVTHDAIRLTSDKTASYSVEHINKPADLSASVTKTNLIAVFSQPQKTVTIDGQDVNGKTLARGTKLQYTLASDTLPADRTDDIQNVSDDDTLSDSLTFNGWHAYQKQADGSLVDVTSEYKLTQNGQSLHWEATPALLARYNQDKSQATNQAYIVIDTTVNADDKKIQNTYSHTLNGRTDSSNTDSNVSVKVTPHKSVLNSDGQNTNGMTLEQGDDVHYAIDWDMTGFDQNTAYSKDQETTGLSVTDKYSDLFSPTKDKLSVFDSKGDDVTKDVDITWGDDTVTIKAKNVKDFISKYSKSTLRINFIGTVKQDAQSGEMSNTAYQNDFGDEHATETVVNKITVTNPSKTAELNGQALKDGDKVVLNSVLPYVVQSSLRPANVGEPTKAWSLSDKFDAEYDQYLGQWTITASRDFTMPDGTVVKAGTSLNDYFGNQLANYFVVDYRDGTLSASLTDKMLAIMNSDTNRKTEQAWSLTAVTKRIKDGTVHNTGIEKYNNRTTNTNTVSTVTPKVYTSWVDETGAPLKPEVEGTFPGGDIPDYKFLRTVTDGDGNTTNFYQALYTSWVDENGNPLKPQEKGLSPGGDISGYKFVKTVTDKDGNLINLYEKIVEPVVTPTATAEPQAQAPVVPQSPMPATGKDTHSDNKALLGLAVASSLTLFGLSYRRQNAE